LQHPSPANSFTRFATKHHIEMRLTEVLITAESPPTQTPAYACPGYFIAAKHGQVERDMVPRVTCPHDGQRMYLSEINPERREFRLWRCPQCDSTRTNEEGLVNGLP
jgi:hypothetical protein